MLWQIPPALPRLNDGVIHVWLVNLRTPVEDRHRASLSADERARADRFRFEHLQQAYIIAHSTLRQLLSHYSATPTNALEFHQNPHGKPALADSAIQFNLSHSGDLALIAVTSNTAIGVDIEAIKPLDDMMAVSRSLFSPAERATLERLPAAQRIEGFYNCWTRKEAYIKVIGKGLAQPLDEFDVSLAPGQPAALLRVEGVPDASARWSMEALLAPEGYAAALAVERGSFALHSWQY